MAKKSKITPLDLFGRALKVGDLIAFATGTSAGAPIRLGVFEKFTGKAAFVFSNDIGSQRRSIANGPKRIRLSTISPTTPKNNLDGEIRIERIIKMESTPTLKTASELWDFNVPKKGDLVEACFNIDSEYEKDRQVRGLVVENITLGNVYCKILFEDGKTHNVHVLMIRPVKSS
jgi:hypothetical protein|tara:strand:+ start:2302 stop:2823 length:522 start_codon:yes stop_codon:yes gene_type:complete